MSELEILIEKLLEEIGKLLHAYDTEAYLMYRHLGKIRAIYTRIRRLKKGP